MNVWWLSLHDDIPARGYWDQTVVEHLLSRLPWDVHHRTSPPPWTPRDVPQQPDGGGAVVVVPGAAHDPQAVSDAVQALDWTVLVVTGDEGSTFDVSSFGCPVWVQNPRSDLHPPHIRGLPVGWTPHVDVRYTQRPPPVKTRRWGFAGQVTHRRRRAADAVMRRMADGRLVTSEAFTEGVSRREYADILYDAKVAPCPAGIVTPDTFRSWEALRAGAVPLVDRQAGEWDVPGDYWTRLCGDGHPLQVVDDWADLPDLVEETCRTWPRQALTAGGWWSRWLHRLRRDLTVDVRAQSGMLGRRLAVYMPTSPIPSHPDTGIITETVASVRDRLPDVPIHIAADGVRHEQARLTSRYKEYLRRLLYLAQHHFGDCTVHLHRRHRHQSGMLHTVLPRLDADVMLYVEHDTPLAGDIPFDALTAAVQTDRADVIRLHHETHILDAHRHLMVDDTPQDLGGVPALRTGQWSQRPHLATTGFYRRVAGRYFGEGARTMVEDVMHGVVATDFAENGWGRWRLWVYAPDGDMRRSTHLDARGDEPKFPMIFDYDGEPPEFAPAPTADRSGA